jgi:hypothetical protein
MDRVSVPLWGTFLSEPLPIAALVGRYPANWLIGREPIRHRRGFQPSSMQMMVLWDIRRRFRQLSPCDGHVAHALRTLSPVAANDIAATALPLDLHVLSLPLAFILSQDQTLLCIFYFLVSPGILLPSRNQRSRFLFSVLACTSFSLFNDLQIVPFIQSGTTKIRPFLIKQKYF